LPTSNCRASFMIETMFRLVSDCVEAMWRRSRLPETYWKRRVLGTIGPHVIGEKLFPWNGAHGFNHVRRVQDTVFDKVLNESLPLNAFHL